MKFRIITPERIVLEDDVDAVYVETEHGRIGFLPKHIPYISTLRIDVAYYTKGKNKYYASVLGGIIKVDHEGIVTILANGAELGSEIDEMRAIEARTRATSFMNDKNKDIDLVRAEAALTRSLARLKAKTLSD